MIYVRRYMLDEFRKVVTTEYAIEAELEADIRGHGKPVKWQMQAGDAWHRLLAGEPPDTGADLIETSNAVGLGGFSFDADLVMDAQRYLGPGVYELTAREVFHLGGVPVEVEATADHVHGLVIQDNKTNFAGVDPESYEDSLQWRFYLLIHRAVCFRYNCFDFKEPKDGYCVLKDLHSFRFWPYPDLRSDCLFWLREFVQWARSRQLLPYLAQRRPNR